VNESDTITMIATIPISFSLPDRKFTLYSPRY
jgi:hypothetical protein